MSPKAFIFADFHLGQRDLQCLSASVSSVIREECRATAMAGCLAALLCQATSLLLVVACGWDLAYLLSGGITDRCLSHRHQGGKLLSAVAGEKKKKPEVVYVRAPQHTSARCHLQIHTLIMLIYMETLFTLLHPLFQMCFWTKRRMHAGGYAEEGGSRRLTVGGVSREIGRSGRRRRRCWGGLLALCGPSVHSTGHLRTQCPVWCSHRKITFGEVSGS